MNRILIIVPYFGKLPNYFQLWLNSCGLNSKIEWLLLTDDKTVYNYPRNVLKKNMTFNEFKNKIQDKFEFQISLKNAYKICDYRVAYGYIFEDLLENYSHWGYCDTDLIFGDLESFIQKIDLENYDKILTNGHLTFYKNNYINNRIFMKESSLYNYKDVFKNNISFGFDESENLNNLFIKNDKKIFYSSQKLFLDIDYRYNNLYLKGEKKEKYLDKYSWENGKIYRYSYKNNKIIKQEYMYIHLQKRKMEIENLVENNNFLIEYNGFKKLFSKDSFKKRNLQIKIMDNLKYISWNIKKVKLSIRYKYYILKNKMKK